MIILGIVVMAVIIFVVITWKKIKKDIEDEENSY